MYRNVHCIYNGKTAKEHGYIKCEPALKPSQSQTCYKMEGCNAEWHTSDWSPVCVYMHNRISVKYIILIYSVVELVMAYKQER